MGNVFDKLQELGYQDTIPIIPATATLSSQSKVKEADRGKVPGRVNRDGDWIGFKSWQDYEKDEKDHADWKRWGAGCGLRTGRVFAIDIDVTDSELSFDIVGWVQARIGKAPMRTGRQPKALLVYRCTEDLFKRKLAFTDKSGQQHAVELLGKGQQFVCHGVHPSGRRYSWNTESKTLPPLDTLIELTPQMVDDLWEALRMHIEALECSLTEASKSSGDSDRKLIGDESLRGDPDLVRKALDVLPNKFNYDDWIKMCAAIKAALGGEEDHYDIFYDWCAKYEKNSDEDIRKRWESVRATNLGANYLYDMARNHGFSDASEEFEDGEYEFEIGVDKRKSLAVDAMFDNYIWIEETTRFIDTRNGNMLNMQQLNAREVVVGNPANSKTCASMVYLRNADRRTIVWGLTYRPGKGQFVDEPKGRCFNTWKPSPLKLPNVATEAEIKPWLALVEHVIPDPDSRNIILDWAAHTLQHPEIKCNWAVLLGSTAQGIGKDLMFQPLIKGVGDMNTKYIGPSDIAGGYTDWAANAKLVVVEEMHAFDRRETMNKLKAFIAAPPDYIRVNTKYVPQYDIPNVGSYLFFSNIHNALALERGDRRFYVYWSPAQPRDVRFYADVAAFYEAGGHAKVVQWLKQRKLSAFNAKGAAPWSHDKDEMRRAGQDPLAEWVENSIEDGTAPFDASIVAIPDIMARLPVRIERLKPSAERITHLMRSNGAVSAGRPSLGRTLDSDGSKRARLYIIRQEDILSRLSADELVEAFWSQKKKAETRAANSDFFEDGEKDVF